MSDNKEKIVILGGGFGSLTAAWALSSAKDWQDKYEITVYQQGWRLGGKARTGRDVNNPYRIEERGLHIWFGGYDNSFNMLRSVYEELHRAPDGPIPTLDDAFLPQDTFDFEEYINGEWLDWCITFPPNGRKPGDPSHFEHRTVWDLIVDGLEWLFHHLHGANVLHENVSTAKTSSSPKTTPPPTPEAENLLDKIINFLRSLLGMENDNSQSSTTTETSVNLEYPAGASAEKPHWWEKLVDQIKHTVEDEIKSIAGHAESEFLHYALLLAKSLDKDPANHDPEHIGWLKWLIQEFRNWLKKELEQFLDNHTLLRRLWIVGDLGLTCLIGFIDDDLFKNGFNYLDQWDLQEWLRKHGGTEIMVNSAVIIGLYMTLFAYQHGHSGDPRQGDPGKMNLATGAALISFMWSVLEYKGHFVYRMAAGTGDTIIAPMYQVLERRGVKFKFFHRITDIQAIGTQADGNLEVSEVQIARQVDLKVGKYDPLILVRDLPCWPSEALYDQLEQGAELKAKNIDLESYWYPSEWQDVGQLTLKKGKDFDKVILGISIGALPHIASDLIEKNSDWQTMVKDIQTVQTRSVQLWFTEENENVCNTDTFPLIVGYQDPLSSWVNYNNLIYWENQPKDLGAKTVYHTSAVYPDPENPPFPPDESNYPVEVTQDIHDSAVDFLTQHSKQIFPNLSQDSGELDWSKLVDPENREGSARFDAQYWLGNLNPTDRYVRAQSGGNSSARLVPYESGYHNLYVVGTWTYNWAWNLGGMEIAAMSGLQVGREIGGFPKFITGEHIH